MGTKRLGKSKSAQYGLVEITALESETLTTPKEIQTEDRVILYANSRLALIDEDGNPTYDLKYLLDGLEDKNIDYENCQIKISTFTPYNGAMQTKTYERVCIDRGSVILLKGIDKGKVNLLVGAYQSEGFGELLLNPSFLEHNAFELKEKNEEDLKPESKGVKNTLISFLQNRETNKKAKLDILNEVDEFIENNQKFNNKKMNSQWGTIRSLTSQAQTSQELYNLIFEKKPDDKPKGFLRSKKAKDKWNKELIDNIEKKYADNIYFWKFIKLLSIQMPKQGAKNDK